MNTVSYILAEAAQFLKIAKITLRYHIVRGHLPATRSNGWFYSITQDDLLAFNAARKAGKFLKSTGRKPEPVRDISKELGVATS